MDEQSGLLNPQNSFNRFASLSLPKATLTILPGDRSYLPTVAFSYGEAFHTEYPRIGMERGSHRCSPHRSRINYEIRRW